MENKKQSLIDMRLLPIKVHYFVAFAALGGVMPFMPVVAKSLNIHATAVGIIYTIIPFCVLLAKPLFGSISDHFQNIKKVIISVIIFSTIAYLLILAIPPIETDQENFVSMTCQDLSSNTTLPVHYDPKCLLERINQGSVCNIVGKCSTTSGKAYPTDADEICDDINIAVAINVTFDIHINVCRNLNLTDSRGNISHASQTSSNITTCSCLASNYLSLNCTPSFEKCVMTLSKEDSSEVYKSLQFWTFLLLALIGGSGSGALFSLSDAACYALLGDRPDLYGRQRLFATISWGAIAFVTGYFNDLASASFGSTTYAPGFYIMTVLSAADLFILCKIIDLKQATFSQNIWKDIGSLFSSCRIVAFATAVVIVGGLTGMLWNYQFWYLQTLGASQLLLGLTITVQCLAAEVPFFFFSGWIIDRLGHALCLILTFFAFALRYFLYYLLTNPWYVLPIEILHGWTYGVFYASMTSFATHYAPPGTEATMQGVLGGLFEGLGLAVGSLLSGVGFDQLGGRHTFLTAAVVSAVSSVAFSVVTLVLKRKESVR